MTPMPPVEILDLIRKGVAIPASPLALDDRRMLDERHQRALYRYYAAAGSGGIAVGVHTTQFEIRDPKIGLFKPLLEFAAGVMAETEEQLGHKLVRVTGVCGKTPQAVDEAEYAVSKGYHCGLLSLGAMRDASEDELIAHCQRVAMAIPVIGFYLQPAVGGRVLPYSFWRRFAEIENVVAIKMAPFNRYQTIDVIRAVANAGREDDITLYTGNDDNIINDLLTPFTVHVDGNAKTLRIKGGLLGQWSVWTSKAVRLLEDIHSIVDGDQAIPSQYLRRNAELTDANSVVFDAANKFAGCIPGINEVLRRQGLLANNYCLNPHEVLSPGQAEELDRITGNYPWIVDDEFVKANVDNWLR